MVNYTSVINVGVAFLLIMAAGFIAKKLKVTRSRHIAAVNKYVIQLTLRAQMCRAFALKDLYSMSFKPLLGCVCMSLTTQILLAIYVAVIPVQNKFETFIGLVLPVVYLNYVIIGVPLFNSIWGEANNAITSVIIMSNDIVIIPIYQTCASLFSVRKSKEEAAKKAAENQVDGEDVTEGKKFTIKDFGKILLNVFKSPIIQGIIVGMIYSLSTLKLPIYLDRFLYTIQASCVGLALFSAGGFLAKTSLISCTWLEFFTAIGFRFIVMPFFSCVYSYAIKLTNQQIRQCLLMCLVTSSTAVYPIAQGTGIKVGVASTMVLWSTILFVPFMILWNFVLDKMNLFKE